MYGRTVIRKKMEKTVQLICMFPFATCNWTGEEQGHYFSLAILNKNMTILEKRVEKEQQDIVDQITWD